MGTARMCLRWREGWVGIGSGGGYGGSGGGDEALEELDLV